MSATHLAYLDLYGIPRSGYIPPEAMVTSLSALTSPRLPSPSFSDTHDLALLLESRRPPPPSANTLHPLPGSPVSDSKGVKANRHLRKGDLGPDRCPSTQRTVDITFFNQIIFDTPQLFQLISRTPTLRAPEKGHITFGSWLISVRFSLQRSSDYGVPQSLQILCTASE